MDTSTHDTINLRHALMLFFLFLFLSCRLRFLMAGLLYFLGAIPLYISIDALQFSGSSRHGTSGTN
jgi:hypothetical protein